MKQHFPRWPTASPDPIVNIIATGVLVLLALLTIATSFVLLVPIAIGFCVIAFLRWYQSRPQPYTNVALVAEATQQVVTLLMRQSLADLRGLSRQTQPAFGGPADKAAAQEERLPGSARRRELEVSRSVAKVVWDRLQAATHPNPHGRGLAHR